MAESIADAMCNTCNANEVQSERDFFWAIAFDRVDPEIDRYWCRYRWGSLSFERIFELIEDFNIATNGKFEPSEVELFIAQKIWQQKCREDRICTPQFKSPSRNLPLTKYLWGHN